MILNDPESLIAGKPVLMLLCHERTDHLRRVIESIKVAEGVRDYVTLAIIDGQSPEVLSILSSDLEPDFILRIENPRGSLARARIARSLRSGLKFAFEAVKSPYVVVLEDDIQVAPTFLQFVEAAHQEFGDDGSYRGVNGFSREVIDQLKPGTPEPVAKLNYGLGWGWSITDHIYRKLTRLLTHPRRSEWHWDFAIEPQVRTGYVVNPIVSKVRNLGFDFSATHTSGSAAAQLGSQMEQSYAANPTEPPKTSFLITSVGARFSWRQDCVNLASIPRMLRPLLFATTRAVYGAHLLQLSDNAYLRDFGHKLERLLGARLFKPIFCRPRYNGDT